GIRDATVTGVQTCALPIYVAPGPPALTSAAYATDLNESKLMGSSTSLARTPDQTLFSIFWNGNTAGFWNRTAVQLAERYNFSLQIGRASCREKQCNSGSSR